MVDAEYVKGYTSFDNRYVDISNLGDKELVSTYLFFKEYCSTLRTVEHTPSDVEYISYKDNMGKIRDALKHEVQIRGLVMRRFLR